MLEFLNRLNRTIEPMVAESLDKYSDANKLRSRGEALKIESEKLRRQAIKTWKTQTGVSVDDYSLCVGDTQFLLQGEQFIIVVNHSNVFECAARDICPPGCYTDFNALLYGIGLWIRENVVPPTKPAVSVMSHDSEWVVRIANEEEPVASFKTQRSAVQSGVTIAKAIQTELIVYRADGSVRSHDSYDGSAHFSRTESE